MVERQQGIGGTGLLMQAMMTLMAYMAERLTLDIQIAQKDLKH